MNDQKREREGQPASAAGMAGKPWKQDAAIEPPSLQKAQIVVEGTIWFCEHWLERASRTSEQMIQAARAGKQNIVDAFRAGAASKEKELALTETALRTFEELLAAFRTYLKEHSVEEWPRDHRLTAHMRTLNRQGTATYETFRKGIEHEDAGISANVLIGLIKLTHYLLDRQLDELERTLRPPGGGNGSPSPSRGDIRRTPARPSGPVPARS